MSITTIQEPIKLSPVWNSNYFVINDNISLSAAGYEYIIKIYINSVLIGTFISPIEKDTGNLIFDANPILTSYINNNYQYIPQSATTTNQLTKYDILIERRTNTITTPQEIHSFKNYYVSDAAYENEIYNLSQYLPSAQTTTNLVLSDFTNNIYLDYYDIYTLDLYSNNFLSGGSGNQVNIIYYTFYTSLGDKNYYTEIDETDNVIQAPIGPQNILSLTNLQKTNAGDFDNPFDYQPTGYKVTFKNSSFHNVGEGLTIQYTNNICRPRGYDRGWIIYKNKNGGWSQLLFNMKKEQVLEKKATKYTRKRTWDEDMYIRGHSVINQEINHIYKVTSGFIKNSEIDFYSDCFNSPCHYYFLADKQGIKEFMPVILRTSTIKKYTKEDDRVFYYALQIERGHNIIKQQR